MLLMGERDLRVQKERFDETAPKRADGFYDYHYAGFIYYLDFIGDIGYRVRQYDHTPEAAHFLGGYRKWHRRFKRMGNRCYEFDNIPYDDERFVLAVKYLLEQTEIQFIYARVNGCQQPIAPEKLAELRG